MRCLAIALMFFACAGDDGANGEEPDPGDELCDNQIDDDGDGAVDCVDDGCAADPACEVGEPTAMRLITYHSYRGVAYEENTPVVAFADSGDLDATYQVLDGVDGVYDFTVTSSDGRYSLVVACEGRAGVRLHHGVTTDGTELHIVGCLSVDTATFPVLSFLGPVVNNDCMLAAVGFSGLTNTCGADTWFADSVRGPNDIIATTASPSHGDFPDRIVVVHGVDLVANNQSHTIDFQGPLSAAPDMRAVDNGGVAFSAAPFFLTRYTGRNVGPLVGSYAGVPAALREPEDTHRWCSGNVGAPSHCLYFKEPRDLVAPDPPLPTITAARSTPTAGPYARPQIDWTLEGGDPPTGYRLEVTGDPNRLWAIAISAGFLDNNSYQLPDLSAIPGFGEPLHPVADPGLALVAFGDGPFLDAANAEWVPTTAADGLSYWMARAFP